VDGSLENKWKPSDDLPNKGINTELFIERSAALYLLNWRIRDEINKGAVASWRVEHTLL